MMVKPFFLLLCAVAALPAQEDLEHVMEVVRGHVRRLENSVPNFICNEQIVSQLYSGKKRKKETRAEAVLTTTRTVRQNRGTFSEARSEMRINGKATRRNEISGPFVWHGGPSYGDLHFLFNSELGITCLDRKLVGEVKLGKRAALLMETHASVVVTRDEPCRNLREDSSNRIWFDPQSLNVMRIVSFNPPASTLPADANLTLTVDYAPVVFDGSEYWLPSHLISRLDFVDSTQHLRYEAFFSEYHQFGAESVIHIDPVQ